VISLVEILDDVPFLGACTTLTGEPPPTNSYGQQQDPELQKVQAEPPHDYLDENGGLLMQTLRYEYQNPDGSFVIKDGKRKKTFLQRQPSGNGEWLWNIKGVRLVPYRLPALLEALSHERTCFIVEGERPVDLLSSWNVPATCNPMGAGKWPDSFAEFFNAHDNLALLTDHDQEGRNHVLDVGAKLINRNVTVRILEPKATPKTGPKLAEPGRNYIDWSRRSRCRSPTTSRRHRNRKQKTRYGQISFRCRRSLCRSRHSISPSCRAVPKIFDGEKEAKLIALAWSAPPEGRARWTLRLLEEKVVELNIVDKASDNTIGRVLKRHSQAAPQGAVRHSTEGKQSCFSPNLRPRDRGARLIDQLLRGLINADQRIRANSPGIYRGPSSISATAPRRSQIPQYSSTRRCLQKCSGC
jgi:hypothetical protein